MVEFVLNKQKIRTAKPAGFLLLDYIRQEKGLCGTKIGCREGDCGACNVLVGTWKEGKVAYLPLVSCLTPIGNVQGKHVVTVEGLNMADLSPVQQSLVEEGGTQCGFCTVGFVVSLTAYCLSPFAPAKERALAAIDGNICRCTGYKSIERAAQRISAYLRGKDTDDPVSWLVQRKYLPAYFLEIPSMLAAIKPLEWTATESRMVGGGSDLYVQQPAELVNTHPNLISHRRELRFVEIKDGICDIGGGTTFSDLLRSEALHRLFPRLNAHLKLVASSPIRNLATLAGNLVNASPIGDLTIFLLALNAQITLTEDGHSRSLYLKDFFQAYKTLAKGEGEVVQSVSFAIPSPESHFNFEKVSKRTHLDIASVNSAVQISLVNGIINQAHLSAGGVGPVPLYLGETAQFLSGKALSPSLLQAANEVLQSEISPISDVRGSADYKRLLLRQLLYAHFIQLFPHQISLSALR